jgi:bacterioferritin
MGSEDDSMRGNEKVISELNAALKAELTAVSQYLVHAEMCDNWGYQRLAEHGRAEVLEELGHAQRVTARILFLDGTPEVNVPLAPEIGANVRAQLEAELRAEKEALRMYNAAIEVCRAAQDEGSRTLFEELVKDEDGHTDWLESQLHAIGEMGIENYLAQQLYGSGK